MNPTAENDFSTGSIPAHMLRLALPMTLAQLINVLYNIIDRIFIGRIPFDSTNALTGLGVAFPICTITIAFANLVGMGGAPLFSIERGKRNDAEAEKILGNSFVLLLLFGLFITITGLLLKRPLLYLLGASEATFRYADSYITIYLCGSVFVMLSLGLNSFINAQGFAKTGMLSVLIGAVTNIVLDPVFIFGLKQGAAGAAIATVMGSYLTVGILLIHFFTKKNQLKFNLRGIRVSYMKDILVNGTASFLIEVSSGITIFVFNLQLLKYVGNTGVTVFGIICNTAIVVMCLCKGVNQASQPIISVNYGAGQFERTFSVRKLTMITSIIVCGVIVAVGIFAPDFFTYIFLNPDKEILSMSGDAVQIYFIGFLFTAVNMVYICYFQSVVENGYSLLLCLLRGCILVLIFVYVLPVFMGVTGIWLAYPAAELCTMAVGMFVIKRTDRKNFQKIVDKKQS